MLDRGKLVIVFMLLLAVLLAGYAWWHNYRQGRRSLAVWGARTAWLIRHSPSVELLELRVADYSVKSRETLTVANRALAVTSRTAIERVPGLIHARQALLEDASYDWEPPTDECTSVWEFALRFRNADDSATLAFDPACDQVQVALAAADKTDGSRGETAEKRGETPVKSESAGPGKARLRGSLMQAFADRRRQWIEAAVQLRRD